MPELTSRQRTFKIRVVCILAAQTHVVILAIINVIHLNCICAFYKVLGYFATLALVSAYTSVTYKVKLREMFVVRNHCYNAGIEYTKVCSSNMDVLHIITITYILL
jgi:hypothetical protein